MVGRLEATQRAATVTAVLARSLSDPRGGQLAAGLTHLGPVFVKFGQFGASIPAFFPYRFRLSLRGLLDSVPPFGGDVAFR